MYLSNFYLWRYLIALQLMLLKTIFFSKITNARFYLLIAYRRGKYEIAHYGTTHKNAHLYLWTQNWKHLSVISNIKHLFLKLK